MRRGLRSGHQTLQAGEGAWRAAKPETQGFGRAATGRQLNGRREDFGPSTRAGIAGEGAQRAAKPETQGFGRAATGRQLNGRREDFGPSTRAGNRRRGRSEGGQPETARLRPGGGRADTRRATRELRLEHPSRHRWRGRSEDGLLEPRGFGRAAKGTPPKSDARTSVRAPELASLTRAPRVRPTGTAWLRPRGDGDSADGRCTGFGPGSRVDDTSIEAGQGEPSTSEHPPSGECLGKDGPLDAWCQGS